MTTIGLDRNGLIIHYTLAAVLCVLVIMLFLCLVRAIKGPRLADRVIAVNMMGTMVIVIIAILAFILNESYLIDICVIYALISFLAVIVLTKIYTGIYRKKSMDQNTKEGGNDAD